jgi:hypothetical protein
MPGPRTIVGPTRPAPPSPQPSRGRGPRPQGTGARTPRQVQRRIRRRHRPTSHRGDERRQHVTGFRGATHPCTSDTREARRSTSRACGAARGGRGAKGLSPLRAHQATSARRLAARGSTRMQRVGGGLPRAVDRISAAPSKERTPTRPMRQGEAGAPSRARSLSSRGNTQQSAFQPTSASRDEFAP